jgi:uncharacterized protein
MKFRKLLRILHRDLGYFIVGMTIIYALSGIFLNHRHDFNPDYKIYSDEFKVEAGTAEQYDASRIKSLLAELPYDFTYKKHYISNEGLVRVFIESGEVVIDPVKREGVYRYLQTRPVIFEMNKLHKATLGTTWKWVSDSMAVILLLVAITGLFLLKGKRGFMRWGWWLMITGFIVPLVFALLFI